jgi:hypothetical protein
MLGSADLSLHMLHKGVIQNGKLVLDDAASLPDGTRVKVTVERNSRPAPVKSKSSDSLSRIGTRAVETGIRSLADEHDRYAHGKPLETTTRKKRSSARRSSR